MTHVQDVKTAVGKNNTLLMFLHKFNNTVNIIMTLIGSILTVLMQF